MKERITPKGVLYVYEGKVTIDDFLRGQKPSLVINNLIPDIGRNHILDEMQGLIDEVVIGDDDSERSRDDEDLKSEQFSAFPTDKRRVGQQLITELFVGTDEANFTHREFGIKVDGQLMSTLVIEPEFEKDSNKTRTYIHTFDFDG